MIHEGPVRRVVDLLHLVQRGASLIRREGWELEPANGFRMYELRLGEEVWNVDPRIAIAAERKGMVKVSRLDGGAPCS